MKYLSIFGILLFFSACKTEKPVAGRLSYSEPLNKYRIDYPDTLDLTIRKEVVKRKAPAEKLGPDQSAELDSLAEKIAWNNRRIKYSLGWTVRIYSGSDRPFAERLLRELRMSTNEKIEMEYKEPSFIVRVGNYFSREEAHGTYSEIREDYPDAIIIKARIKVDIDKMLGDGEEEDKE